MLTTEGMTGAEGDASFVVHLVSREAGKPAVANAATHLARQSQSTLRPLAADSHIVQNDLNAILEGSTHVIYCSLVLIVVIVQGNMGFRLQI